MILMLVFSIKTYSQKKNSVGISIPVIWNNSSGVYYSTGNRKEPSGEATSYGINVNYSRLLYRGLFVTVGVGYFKQRFGIIRPFDYITPDMSKPLVSARNYFYSSAHLVGGIGYQQKIVNNLFLNVKMTYNVFNSYEQEYTQTFFPNNQINKNAIFIGHTLNSSLEIQKQFSNGLSVGLEIILPIYTKWEKDKIFYDLGRGNDEQIIAKNKFSIGIAINCKYHF